MASTPSSTQADPRFDGGAKDLFAGIEEALARLAHQAASDTPDARPSRPASDRSAEAPTLGPAGLKAPIPREQRPLGKRGTLVHIAIAVCLGVFSAMWAWRSYSAARDLIATWAPSFSARPSADQPPARQTSDPAPEQAAVSPAIGTSAPPPAQAASIAQPATTATNERGAASAEREQIATMARDLAALRQTVEQLSAGQEQLTRGFAKLQAEKPQADKPDKRMLRRVTAPPAPPVAAPARQPAPITPMPPQTSPIAPMPPQAAPQVSTAIPLSPSPQPAAQIPSEPERSDPPPLRPPMPVPQP